MVFEPGDVNFYQMIRETGVESKTKIFLRVEQIQAIGLMLVSSK